MVNERCRGLRCGRSAFLFGQSGRFAHLVVVHLLSVGIGEGTYPTRNPVGAILNIPLISTTAKADSSSGREFTTTAMSKGELIGER